MAGAEGSLIKDALSLANACKFEEKHSLKVRNLALSIFDQTAPLHCLGREERLMLEAGGILHDIGWIKGQKKHHKVAQEIILHSRRIKLNRQACLVLSFIVRYHRKSLPKKTHRYLDELKEKPRLLMLKLAAILRLADGLDRGHCSSVSSLLCGISRSCLTIRVSGRKVLDEDIKCAREKSDLFRRVFKRRVKIVKAKQPF